MEYQAFSNKRWNYGGGRARSDESARGFESSVAEAANIGLRGEARSRLSSGMGAEAAFKRPTDPARTMERHGGRRGRRRKRSTFNVAPQEKVVKQVVGGDNDGEWSDT